MMRRKFCPYAADAYLQNRWMFLMRPSCGNKSSAASALGEKIWELEAWIRLERVRTDSETDTVRCEADEYEVLLLVVAVLGGG
jgi:hypothetical protein